MRDKSIELFRCTMMLFIVVLHVFSYVGLGHTWLPRLCTTGVVGFVFITGYFGLRPRARVSSAKVGCLARRGWQVKRASA